jgi:aspartate aminotransferase
MTQYAAKRLSAVQPSASMAVSHQAGLLRSQGHKVIDLGVGEPDFDTPAHIVEAAAQAGRDGKTRYTPTGGATDLKEAVSAKFVRENNLQVATNEIIISTGAKQVIFDALMATLELGQQVLLCAPHFDIYKPMTAVLGGEPVVIPCQASDQFRLTPQALDAAITPKTRWLILNSPSNPAGAVYDQHQLAELGAVLERHPQVLILADEIYEHIIFDDRKFVSFAAACPQLRERTLTVNGVSKAYAMTGWRIGYGAGPKGLIDAMTKVQSQITSGPASITQAGAVAALTGPQDHVATFNRAFEKRRNIVVDAVRNTPGITLDPPGGAFYTFIGCEALIGSTAADGTTLKSDADFTNYLLNTGKVAAVPGAAYSLSPFFRLSTATSEENLHAAMDQITDCVSALKLA